MNKVLTRAAIVPLLAAGFLAAIAAPPAQATDNVCVIVHITPGPFVPPVCVATPFPHEYHEEHLCDEGGLFCIQVEVYYPSYP
jgi:hypothetical protein